MKVKVIAQLEFELANYESSSLARYISSISL